MRRHAIIVLSIALPVAAAMAGGTGSTGTGVASTQFASLPGGHFRSALKYEDRKKGVRIAPFGLMRRPVTNAEFLAFTRSNPRWQRDQVPATLAGSGYLSQWRGAGSLGTAALPQQPVTHVSWFAAKAYCSAQGARLPTWNEWEYAAAADERHRDARQDPVWRERILDWYSRPSTGALPRVGLQAPNAYGVQDLHGLVWEWTDDFSSLLVSDDNRSAGDGNNTRFCGAGALSTNDPANYAVLMRVAMLSALQAQDSTGNLGFRCARDLP
ncbi:formylglycine-generating enzyme family protein [Cognatiluteimonas profundi]|uniref:formylglycine-generating enzyme family protein n=1 Tax=Cognatiluteimonas profundi TaxID=2594501 RepID=UPI00131C4C3D|nr:formylglycine-generating enzyme family protein [Lysobacter profundi]